jgi:hypothetical protein
VRSFSDAASRSAAYSCAMHSSSTCRHHSIHTAHTRSRIMMSCVTTSGLA